MQTEKTYSSIQGRMTTEFSLGCEEGCPQSRLGVLWCEMGVTFPAGPKPQACILGGRLWRPSFMLVFPPHHPDETLRSLASPSSLQGPELHGWRPPVDCVRANELCAAESNCSSRYRTLRQCLAGRDRNTMLANKECQAALEVLQESPLYDCRCKRGMKKELQCLQIYWSIHLGLTEGKPGRGWPKGRGCGTGGEDVWRARGSGGRTR